MKRIYLLGVLMFLPLLIMAQSNSEFRATWVISWDLVNRYQSVEENKELCRKILDNHKKANMNAVLWQVRQSGTAYYKSSFEPWGYYAGGTNPGYDIFDYAVTEAHKRNLEIHAWFNVFHCSSIVYGAPAAVHPEWVCTNQNGEFMTNNRCLSPGIPEVRDYLIRVAMEIVRKYDIDGLHMDFVRWNEYTEDDMRTALPKEAELQVLDGHITQEQIDRLNDTGTLRYIYDVQHPYNGGVPSGFSSWDDWRRWTVTEFVKVLHDSIQSVKPWVKLSAAVLGKYNWDGWQGYGTVYQDAALWFNEGYVDHLMPMHYHWTSPMEFYSMLAGPNGDNNYNNCWGKYIQKGIQQGRLYSVGPGSYILSDRGVWGNHESIVKKVREIDWVDGFQFFSYATWLTRNYWDEARNKLFPTIAKIGNTVSADSTAPDAPDITITRLDTMVYRISVTQVATGDDPAWFVIYRGRDSTLTKDKSSIILIKFSDEGFHYNDYIEERRGGYFYYGVSAADRFWNESEISNIVRTDELPHESVFPEPPIMQYVKKLDNGYEVKWKHSGVNDCMGYRLYGKAVDTDWYLLLNESTLDAGTTQAVVNTAIEEVPWYFMVRAVGLGPAAHESVDSDVYGTYRSDTQKVLIVDAFDRMTGEWKSATHPFAKRVAESLSRLNISFDCASDEAFEDKYVLPDDYKAVIWLAGDAVGQDEAVSYNNMSYLANYLKRGGGLLISGSEIAYDLDYKGNFQDKKFIHEYLKTTYRSNGSAGNGYQVEGDEGGIFQNLTFEYDNGEHGFRVLTPDIIDTTGGSVPCLNYFGSPDFAGTQYRGSIGNGTDEARVITLGFPCEAIYAVEQLDQFFDRVLEFFTITGSIDIAEPARVADRFTMCRNYPNPFNAATNIQFSIDEAMDLSVDIYNIRGQVVYSQAYSYDQAGLKTMKWDGADQSSGVYHYRIYRTDAGQQTIHFGKMLYLK